VPAMGGQDGPAHDVKLHVSQRKACLHAVRWAWVRTLCTFNQVRGDVK
jgi:hypothetical protein